MLTLLLLFGTLENGFHRITDDGNYLFEEFVVHDEKWLLWSCQMDVICDPDRNREQGKYYGYTIEDGRYSELWGGNQKSHTFIHVDLTTGALSFWDRHTDEYKHNRTLDISYDVFKPGDSTLDGRFNSRDLVEVFGAGTYETEQHAFFMDGDWNLDARFNSGDLIAAFQAGGYETSAVAVPEPSMILLLLALLNWRKGRE